jgi:hypothetical protein
MPQSYLLLLFIIISFVSCTKLTETVPPNQSGVSSQGTKISVVYPHTIAFFKEHGLAYMQDKTQCASCHGPNSVTENPRVSCTQCHASYPHAENWKQKTEHAANYIKNPQTCSACHGVDGEGGISRVSCKTCHDYPHPKKWAVPTNHGVTYAAAADKETCFKCHEGAQPEGGLFAVKAPETNAPKCEGCHAAYPLPHKNAEWAGDSDIVGHHKIIAKTPGGKCLICHRDYTQNMPGFGEAGGCKMCHVSQTNPNPAQSLLIQWVDDQPMPPPPCPTETPKKEGEAKSPTVIPADKSGLFRLPGKQDRKPSSLQKQIGGPRKMIQK